MITVVKIVKELEVLLRYIDIFACLKGVVSMLL